MNEEYNTVIPLSKINAVTVMNMGDAKRAFQYLSIDFIIALNEKEGTPEKVGGAKKTRQSKIKYNIKTGAKHGAKIFWPY